LISKTVTADDGTAANALLRNVIDEGDSYQGADVLTSSLHRLGLKNTFMAAPYGTEDSALTVVTPANSRTDVDTKPDDSMQTTPLDMGLLLEMIYQCDRGGGALLVVHSDALTPDQCGEMIEWMSENRIDSLIEVGVPVGTQVAHKEGLSADAHADVGLVFSPGGDFVLSVFLYRPDWLPWEESAPLISNIATASYNYFNPE
jgi:beta-lactamase class A